MSENRYARHLALPGFTSETQELLFNSSVLVVGAGGLGCPALLYLAAAGVGTIGIADPDRVSSSNLQRQILYRERDVGHLKVDVSAKELIAYNSDIQVIKHPIQVTAEQVFDLISKYDYVIDGTDNFPTRYLLNDACFLKNKIYIYGSIFQFEGHLSVFNAPDSSGIPGPNYRDLFPKPPPPEAVPDCAEGGVLGILPGIIGTAQASETIKHITKIGTSLSGKLWIFDAESMMSRIIEIPKRQETSIKNLIDYDTFCGLSRLPENHNLSIFQLKEWQKTSRPHRLIDVRTAAEFETGHLNAELIPLDKLEQNLAELIPESVDIVFYCQSGKRSQKAIEMIGQKGRSKGVYHLEGGLNKNH